MGIFDRTGRHGRHHTDEPRADRGRSLARVPALLLGTILVAFGLAGLLENSEFPPFAENFTDGRADGETFLGLEVNGWTNWLSIASGALLLLGAAQHALARLTSLIVGLVLGAASVIALYDGNDVLGLAAANGPTKLALGLASAWLLVTSLLPRTRRQSDHDDAVRPAADRHETRTVVAEPARTGRFDREPERTPITDDAGVTHGAGAHHEGPTGPERR